jgi:hypothetical protein
MHFVNYIVVYTCKTFLSTQVEENQCGRPRKGPLVCDQIQLILNK